MTPSDDLTWLANNLTRRAREQDRLTLAEMRQLAAMLEAIRDGKGACAPEAEEARNR